MKYWLDQNQLIVITDSNILFGTYTPTVLKHFIAKLEEGIVPNDLVGIPIRYIRQIESSPANTKLFFTLRKDNLEEIKFSDKSIRNDAFRFISNNFQIFQPSKANNKRLVKNYLRAIAGLSFLFIAVYTIDPGQITANWKNGIVVGLAIFIDKYLNNETFFAIVAATFIWRTYIFVHGLNETKKTKVLKRISF
jgi:hypothetical protein